MAWDHILGDIQDGCQNGHQKLEFTRGNLYFFSTYTIQQRLVIWCMYHNISDGFKVKPRQFEVLGTKWIHSNYPNFELSNHFYHEGIGVVFQNHFELSIYSNYRYRLARFYCNIISITSAFPRKWTLMKNDNFYIMF